MVSPLRECNAIDAHRRRYNIEAHLPPSRHRLCRAASRVALVRHTNENARLRHPYRTVRYHHTHVPDIGHALSPTGKV